MLAPLLCLVGATLCNDLRKNLRIPTHFTYAQYTPPTPTRRNCRVASRRRCVHEFATSWRQFRRVAGVNTPVGSREPGHGRRLRCAFESSNPSAVVANSCTHRRRRRDATNSFISSASAVCIGLYTLKHNFKTLLFAP